MLSRCTLHPYLGSESSLSSSDDCVAILCEDLVRTGQLKACDGLFTVQRILFQKWFLCDITFRNCPITAWVASGKASVSGLASLLKEDGTFLAVFCSRCNFRAKTRFQTLATQATQNMHFFILTNRLLKIYTFLLPSQRWRK